MANGAHQRIETFGFGGPLRILALCAINQLH